MTTRRRTLTRFGLGDVGCLITVGLGFVNAPADYECRGAVRPILPGDACRRQLPGAPGSAIGRRVADSVGRRLADGPQRRQQQRHQFGQDTDSDGGEYWEGAEAR
jgi:hypothetical protein